MSQIDELKNVPEISFVNTSIEGIREELLSDYAAYMQQETGITPDIAASHPMRLLINAVSMVLYNFAQVINNAGRSNFLKYAVGSEIDNLAALKGVKRMPAQNAGVVIRLSMTDVRNSVTAIPGGTRVCTADRVYFATSEYAEIPAGELSVDVYATAIVAGIAANGYVAGAINTIVDPVPYIAAVTNITVSSGGTDIETDDSLTRRTYLAPASYSVAGPAQAYEYFAKQSRADISDVFVSSPSPGMVNIVFTLNGDLPSDNDINLLEEYLSANTIRPLTDNVVVAAPTEIGYTIDLTYYIGSGNSTQVSAIQAAVAAAIADYQSWQRKIGRNINPSELIHRIMAAGASRAEVISPIYTTVDASQISSCTAVNAVYGGLDDD